MLSVLTIFVMGTISLHTPVLQDSKSGPFMLYRYLPPSRKSIVQCCTLKPFGEVLGL